MKNAKAERVITDVKVHTPFTWDVKEQLVHQGRVAKVSSLPELIDHHLDLEKKKKTWAVKEPTGWENI